jgi:acyl transferase domain-containing protein/2-polyprenyl-3-methyl-5-hydroxy-6-metoxy-1,4-benzoquinol methylase
MTSSAYRRGLCSALAKEVNIVPGSMLAVGSGEQAIEPLTTQTTKGLVKVACVNSPDSITISGDDAAIDELQEILKSRDIFNRKLKVDTAYHSHHMEKIAGSYLQSLEEIQASEPLESVGFYSSVTGTCKTSGFGASYWTENLVSKVRFSDALQALARDMAGTTRDSVNIFVEIGPHSALSGPIRQTLAQICDYKNSYVSALVRNKDAIQSTLSAVGHLCVAGYSVNMKSLLNLEGSDAKFETIGNLAPYPWDHGTKYWYESRLSRDHRLRSFPNHDLLGLLDVASNLHEPRWRYHINVNALPWLRHHVVDGIIIYPGAGYICMAIEAMSQLVHLRKAAGPVMKFVLRNVTFSRPIVVQTEALEVFTPDVEVQLVMSRSKTSESSPWETFRILSYSQGGSWSEHCTGLIMAELASPSDDVEGTREDDMTHSAYFEKLERIKLESTSIMDPEEFYSTLKSTGNDFGPSFSALTEISFGAGQGYAKVAIPDIRSIMPQSFMQPHIIHPATLDALNQLAALIFKRQCSNAPLMPAFMSEITISTNIMRETGDELLVALELNPEGKSSASGNTLVFQKDKGEKLSPVFTISAWQLRAIGEEVDMEKNPFHRKMSYRLSWMDDADFLTGEQFSDIISSSDACPTNKVGIREQLELNEKAAAIYLRNALLKVDGESDKITSPHLASLFRWIKSFCESEGCTRLLAETRPEVEEEILQSSVEAGVEGEMLARIGSNLAGILTGAIDSLSLMLEGDLLGNFYSNGLFVPSYEHMVKYIEILAYKKPHMDILEIGAGTGGATLPLIQALDRPEGLLLNRYHYTDISSGFFEQARAKFREWESFIDFKTLDITKDPCQQGFEENKYDVIVASNVLHATRSMAETILHVRKLLKPGGRLLLVELTRLTAAINTIFGTLPG